MSFNINAKLECFRFPRNIVNDDMFPWHIRNRWNRKVLSLRKRHQKEPTLSDLSYFTKEEPILTNYPFVFQQCSRGVFRNYWNLLETVWRWIWQEPKKKEWTSKKRDISCVRRIMVLTLASNTKNFKLIRSKGSWWKVSFVLVSTML